MEIRSGIATRHTLIDRMDRSCTEGLVALVLCRIFECHGPISLHSGIGKRVYVRDFFENTTITYYLVYRLIRGIGKNKGWIMHIFYS